MRINKMKLFCSGTQTFIGPQNAPGKTEGECDNFLLLSDQSNIKQYEDDKQPSLICSIFKTILENKRLDKIGS